MTPAAQALFCAKIDAIRNAGRVPQLLDYARAKNAAREEAAQPQTSPTCANDNDLDALLSDLPLEFPGAAPVYPITHLDGTPAEHDPAPRPLARFPQKASLKPRTSYARDKRNLKRFSDFAPDVRPTPRRSVGRPSVGDTPSPPCTSSSPSHTPSKSTTKRRKADENDARSAPAWNRTTDIIKGHAFIRTVSSTGGGLSWTLNLGGKVAQAANDNPTKIKQVLHDRITKALKAVLGAPREFVFGLEATKDGRWHAHGALDGVPAESDRLEEALRRAGGTWGSTHHRDRQAHARSVVWSGDGWARYMLKGMAATKARLGIKSVLSVTRGCRERAEALWRMTRSQSPLTVSNKSVVTD